MENDYYLHNFHVMNARNATTFMKNHELAFCINCTDDEDEVESPVKAQSTGSTLIPHTTSMVESERVARIRKHCTKQNSVLSSWWKVALSANLQEKNLLRFGTMKDTKSLPGRFERVYQPEKLTQFDRVLSRAWETPVRRSHAAQHAEGTDGDDSCDFARVISVDVLPSNGTRLHIKGDVDVQGTSISDFVATHDLHFENTDKLKTFTQFFDHPTALSLRSGTLNHDYFSELTKPPEIYRQCCEAMSNKFHDYSFQKVDEFNGALHDLRLCADDVTGICEVSYISQITLTFYYFLETHSLRRFS